MKLSTEKLTVRCVQGVSDGRSVESEDSIGGVAAVLTKHTLMKHICLSPSCFPLSFPPLSAFPFLSVSIATLIHTLSLSRCLSFFHYFLPPVPVCRAKCQPFSSSGHRAPYFMQIKHQLPSPSFLLSLSPHPSSSTIPLSLSLSSTFPFFFSTLGLRQYPDPVRYYLTFLQLNNIFISHIYKGRRYTPALPLLKKKK